MRVFRRLTALALSGFTISCAGQSAGTLPTHIGDQARAGIAGAKRFEPEQLWGAVRNRRWEPVTAADPSSQWVYQMTTRQRPDALLFRASADSGTTWQPLRYVCRRGVRVPFQYDPQIAVAGDGTIDVVCLDGFLPGVVFVRSHDHGAHWTKAMPLARPLKYSDKPTLAISRDGKNVYVAFNSRYALYVAASHDGGTTWIPRVKATTKHYWYYSYGGTVAPDGSVWFAVDGEGGVNETGGGHVALVSSSDGGASWRVMPFVRSHEGAPCREHNCYPDYFTAQDAVAADASGHLAFAFEKNDRKQGPNSLYVTTSSNGGRSWTSARVIANRGDSTCPAIVAGPSAGDFRLVWQDNRNGFHSWNTWYSRSTDGGATWTPPIRLSDRGTGAPYKHREGYDLPFGDYLGLAVDSRGTNYVIWGEGSAIYSPGGTWWTIGG
ncbi:MAG: exo-alpha-sialidase [Candidatus Eremiobacteraeota bacterium]|nr:exo-alpha-sialidase [Candidatus Eremiobacteraeota bacterium]MBV9699536.1 exo-alpha-sialidase [Candidatus Eremiobacteraeota bacterium]